jgi:hypothetical protein
MGLRCILAIFDGKDGFRSGPDRLVSVEGLARVEVCALSALCALSPDHAFPGGSTRCMAPSRRGEIGRKVLS